jgi:potassium-transporting ATPase potassium-binding subunit
MTARGLIEISGFLLVIAAITKPFGGYLFRVFETEARPLPRVFGLLERLACRFSGVDPKKEQTWKEYAVALIAFSAISMLVTYLIQRAQQSLPLNPQDLPPVSPDLAFNTAASFTTNTNWQSYSGESTMSYLTQMAGLVWHNFTSAAAGLGVALALARGLTRKREAGAPPTLGNFWVDLIRAHIYVLLPVSIAGALFFISQGVVQTFAGYREVMTIEGAKQTIALGPVASQEVIKIFGINGGGFFNANSAHPFENPTPLTNFVQLVLIFSIPAALTATYGKMTGDPRQGWAIFAAMSALFLAGALSAYWAESHPNPALADIPGLEIGPNLEGKEMRFGITDSVLFATVTTDASCGAVNAMHESFTPLGGLVPLANIELGEVVFGGVGAGLYGMLIYVILAVFIAGLMVGRTPEYLGKKIEAKEVKLATLYILIFPLIILVFSASAAVAPSALSSLGNRGPHGLAEILYAFSSGAGNNGSAFAGLNANTPFYNITIGLAMLFGRFWMMLPALAIGGAMVSKKTVSPGPGTFPTNGLLFAVLLVAVVVIVGALTFFPALSLAPIIEHFVALEGKAF